MIARDLLAEHIAHGDLCPGTTTVDEWLGLSWARIRFGSRLVPLIPLWGLKRALVAHDLHHALLGYPTTLRGEVETAAWELASGGCGWNLPFWIDRFLAVALGAPFWPRATWRALRRGICAQNLFGWTIERLLAADVDALRRRLCADDAR
ncbi:MAG: hypothetical protein AB7O97_08645 [Planctomycetota bacterium]